MFVHVTLRDKQFSISCGPATQPLRWLADVACLRYDGQQGKLLGPPVGLRSAKGAVLDWDVRVKDALHDGDAVVVVLRRDVEEQMHQRTWSDRAAEHEDDQDGDEEDEEEEEEEKEQGESKEQTDDSALPSTRSSDESSDDGASSVGSRLAQPRPST